MIRILICKTANLFHCGIPLAAFLKPAIWCCTTLWRLQKGRCSVAKRRTPPPKERYWKDIFTPYILSTPLSFYSMYNVDLINSSCDLSLSPKVKISCVNPEGWNGDDEVDLSFSSDQEFLNCDPFIPFHYCVLGGNRRFRSRHPYRVQVFVKFEGLDYKRVKQYLSGS